MMLYIKKILQEYEEEKSRKESILNLKKSKSGQSSNESKKQIVLEKNSINENSPKDIVNDYHDSQKVNDISTMGNALGVSKVEVTNNKGVTGVISPSDNPQTIGSVAPNIQKKEGVKEEFNTNKVKAQKEAGLLKSMGRGFAYLYVNKTSNMLNPVRFFMEHYKNVNDHNSNCFCFSSNTRNRGNYVSCLYWCVLCSNNLYLVF